MRTKVCNKCKEEKAIDKFKKENSKWCKKCQAERRRRYRMRQMRDYTYLKLGRKGHPIYYFAAPKDCKCDVVENQCMYCTLKERPILKYLKNEDDDFWNERKLKSIEKKRWMDKIKEGYTPKTIPDKYAKKG